MLFAQFFCKSAIGPELVEACGDRSVVILDARYSNATNGQIAATECAKRGYLAWRVYRGDTFTRSIPVSQIWYVAKVDPVVDPAYLSALAS